MWIKESWYENYIKYEYYRNDIFQISLIPFFGGGV